MNHLEHILRIIKKKYNIINKFNKIKIIQRLLHLHFII